MFWLENIQLGVTKSLNGWKFCVTGSIPFERCFQTYELFIDFSCRDFKLNFHSNASFFLADKDFRKFTEFESLKGLTLTPMVFQVYLLSVCLGLGDYFRLKLKFLSRKLVETAQNPSEKAKTCFQPKR